VPVPKLNDPPAPTNVKSPVQAWGKLAATAVTEGVVSRNPPAMVRRFEIGPNAPLLPTITVPLASVNPPVKVLLPDSVRPPEPPLITDVDPLMTPLSAELAELAYSSTPVPEIVPAYVPVVPRSCPAPPITSRDPPLIVVLPVNVLTPDSATVPEPVIVGAPTPLTGPENPVAKPFVSNVVAAAIATAFPSVPDTPARSVATPVTLTVPVPRALGESYRTRPPASVEPPA
jgi:hypothetical protein